MPNISLPPQYIEKLRAEKKLTGKGYAEIIRAALDLYFRQKGQA
jgi:hypothetical protein